MASPVHREDWLAGLALGALIGALVLGIGGRVAMRLFALARGQPPGFSLGGTMTVVFMGAVFGAAGGLAFVLARRLLRAHRAARAVLFWAVCLVVSLQLLSPIDALRAALFLPLVAAYAAGLQLTWCRVYLPRRSSGAAVTA